MHIRTKEVFSLSYTALYRRWRSRTFDEIKGQDAITASFKNQIMTGRIGHAYLFCGTRGTGKTSVAKILARAVNCEHPIDGNPCNECPSCQAILRESSMNVVEMDAASNNGVDDIRQIRDKIQYPPVDGRYKVYIIDEVHMLSQSAFNAFLKTLEEPPSYVIFILATTEPNKIPITILSRCQRYDFKRITTDTIAARLREISDAENIQVSDEALHYIARSGDGSMRDAVSLLDQCAAFQFDRRIEYEDALSILGAVDTAVFSDLVRALSKKDVKTGLQLVAEVIDQGRELSQFVSDFVMYARNMLLASTVDDLSGLVDMSSENLKRLKEDASLLSTVELMRYIRMLSDLSNQLRYATQKRILIETSFMKLAYPETDASPEGMNARLAEIQRTLRNLPVGTSLPTAAAAANAAEQSNIAPQPALAPTTKTVTLPRAQYEDLQLLKKEWRSICAAITIPALSAALIRDESYVRPDRDRSGMTIVTRSKATAYILAQDASIPEIRRIVAEKYHKDIRFTTVLSEEDEAATVYVTDEDLSKIHMQVETEG